MRRSPRPSTPLYATLVRVLPSSGRSKECFSADSSPCASVGVFETEVCVEARRNDLDRVMILGNAPCRVCSYGIARSGIEFERRLICLRATRRWDVVRNKEGILAWTFFARRQNDFTCWLVGVKGRSRPGSRIIGIAYCTSVEVVVGTVAADLQYDSPPINGGGGTLMLASSQAFTSRITPESGRGGRGGGWIARRGDGHSMLMGICGTGGTGVGVARPLLGAVCGRLVESFLLMPPSASLLSNCRDAGSQSRLCSHFFAVSCLLDAVNVFVLVAASIVAVARLNMELTYAYGNVAGKTQKGS